MNNKVKAAITAAALATSIVTATPAHATIDGNCETLNWPELLNWGQLRTICDDPVQSNQSWARRRILWTPAHQVPTTTNCYGYRYVTCTSYGGYFQPEVRSEDSVYIVFPDNVLQNEPGHLG